MSRDDEALHMRYTASVFRALKWRATWLPNASLDLGAVGFLRDGVFDQRTTLKELGISFKPKSAKSKASFDYQSSSGISVMAKAAGEAAPEFSAVGKASAGVLISFSRAGAVVLSAPSCRIVEIDQVSALERKLRVLRKNKQWDRNWVVITKIVKAPSSTILVSGSDKASVELRATASLGSHEIDLARIGVGFSLARHRDVAVRIVAAGGLSPPEFHAAILTWGR